MARLKLNSEIEDEYVIVEPSTEADECAAITAFITNSDFVWLQERACKMAVNRQNVLTLSLACVTAVFTILCAFASAIIGAQWQGQVANRHRAISIR